MNEKKVRPRPSRRRKNEKGTAIIEFAAGSLILIPLLFGIADFGRLFFYSNEVANAASTGAIYGSYSSSNMTNSNGISTAAQNDAPDISNLSVTSSKVCQDSSGSSVSCSTSGAYQYAKVTASYTFTTLLEYPYIPSSLTLSRTVMMRAQ